MDSAILHQPELPPCLQGTAVAVEFDFMKYPAMEPMVQFHKAEGKSRLPSGCPPMRVGVVFCGTTAPGRNNHVWGLHSAIKIHNPNSILLGFVEGSYGLCTQKTIEITEEVLSAFKNQGGDGLLGESRYHIGATEEVSAYKALDTCNKLQLDGLIIIGGVISNTNAAQLAEIFAEKKCPTKVVGVPVTTNGDLKNWIVETNVGFHTMCEATSQHIRNWITKQDSKEKASDFYYFIRVTGNKASHVALECTLMRRPNMVILMEDMADKLSQIVKRICDGIEYRASQGKYHGVIFVPEGPISVDFYDLVKEIQCLPRKRVHDDYAVASVSDVSSRLSRSALELFDILPQNFKDMLVVSPFFDDPAQSLQIGQEEVLSHLVQAEIKKRWLEGTYKGRNLKMLCNFFGFHSRDSAPSKFDCDYAYALGHICYHILAAGLNGYMATVTNLKNHVNQWRCGAVPLRAMMTREPWHPSALPREPAIHAAPVDRRGRGYKWLRRNARKLWRGNTHRISGPLQFDSDADGRPISLCLEDEAYMVGPTAERGWVNPVSAAIAVLTVMGTLIYRLLRHDQSC